MSRAFHQVVETLHIINDLMQNDDASLFKPWMICSRSAADKNMRIGSSVDMTSLDWCTGEFPSVDIIPIVKQQVSL
jgi:hypothetical protein